MSGFSARCVAVILAIGASLAAPAAARADNGPVIVIPSRPGVPVVINGRDASYAVVEGDWGLSRPGFMAVTVIGGSPIRPNRVYEPRNSYHPRYGHAPPRGRNEVEPSPDRALPEPAESFSRSWSTRPEPQPANDTPPQWQGRAQSYNSGTDPVPANLDDPQSFNPTIVVAPRRRRH